jgi:hypothetical protein
VLGVLWGLSNGWLPGWVVLLPGLEWLLAGLAVGWPLNLDQETVPNV